VRACACTLNTRAHERMTYTHARSRARHLDALLPLQEGTHALSWGQETPWEGVCGHAQARVPASARRPHAPSHPRQEGGITSSSRSRNQILASPSPAAGWNVTPYSTYGTSTVS